LGGFAVCTIEGRGKPAIVGWVGQNRRRVEEIIERRRAGPKPAAGSGSWLAHEGRIFGIADGRDRPRDRPQASLSWSARQNFKRFDERLRAQTRARSFNLPATATCVADARCRTSASNRSRTVGPDEPHRT